VAPLSAQSLPRPSRQSVRPSRWPWLCGSAPASVRVVATLTDLADFVRQIGGDRVEVDYIVRAFQAGATGYVVKESASNRLMLGIDAVLRGEYFMDSSVAHEVVRKLLQFPD